jgi:hypothetical protein
MIQLMFGVNMRDEIDWEGDLIENDKFDDF